MPAVNAEVTIPVAVKLDGIVLFNRFYQADYDLESMEVVPHLTHSNTYELLLRLHWVAVMTSALLKRGVTFIDTLATDLLVWLGEHEYDSIRQMQGSMSRNAVPQPKAFERANYMQVLSSYAMR